MGLFYLQTIVPLRSRFCHLGNVRLMIIFNWHKHEVNARWLLVRCVGCSFNSDLQYNGIAKAAPILDGMILRCDMVFRSHC